MVLKWSKKAQTTGIFFLLMIGIVIFILAFSLASPLKNSADQARTNLNCSNSSIDTSQKVTCGVTDITTPFVIGVIFALGAMAFGAKLIIG